MIIPNLPTDNLYKFIALSGMSLILISIYLYLSTFENIKNELSSIGYEMALLTLDIENKEYDLKENAENTITPEAHKELLNENREMRRKNGQHAIQVQRNCNRLQELQSLKGNVKLLLLFGLVMSLTGFQQWYVKIQKPMDEKISLELKLMKEHRKTL